MDLFTHRLIERMKQRKRFRVEIIITNLALLLSVVSLFLLLWKFGVLERMYELLLQLVRDLGTAWRGE